MAKVWLEAAKKWYAIFYENEKKCKTPTYSLKK